MADPRRAVATFGGESGYGVVRRRVGTHGRVTYAAIYRDARGNVRHADVLTVLDMVSSLKRQASAVFHPRPAARPCCRGARRRFSLLGEQEVDPSRFDSIAFGHADLDPCAETRHVSSGPIDPRGIPCPASPQSSTFL